MVVYVLGFPGAWDSKEFACNAGDRGLIPGLGRCPGEGNGNPLQYSCLENPIDRGAWRATVHGVARVGHDSVTTPLCVYLPSWTLSSISTSSSVCYFYQLDGASYIVNLPEKKHFELMIKIKVMDFLQYKWELSPQFLFQKRGHDHPDKRTTTYCQTSLHGRLNQCHLSCNAFSSGIWCSISHIHLSCLPVSGNFQVSHRLMKNPAVSNYLEQSDMW